MYQLCFKPRKRIDKKEKKKKDKETLLGLERSTIFLDHEQ